jgi:truncated hemoglobin YjbI/quinol monooxygenase YgiN
VIVQYVRYRVPSELSDDFVEAYQRAAACLSRAPECVDYELSRSTAEPSSYILRITWTSAKDQLEGFRNSDLYQEFSSATAPFADDVEEASLYQRTAVRGAGGSIPSMYDWVGGTEALERLMERFYDLVASDDLIGPLFKGMDPGHPRYVAMWLAEVFGGPARYTTERGGYHHMLTMHLGKAITEPMRRRWVSLLMDAADQVAIPGDPEFRAAFAGYIEWGTRLAFSNSQPGADPVQQAPVPHWGWGVAPPYNG